MVLHFYDAAAARQLTRRLVDGMPYGSYLIVSVGQLDGEVAERFSKEYSADLPP
jgi:hypothetical protein